MMTSGSMGHLKANIIILNNKSILAIMRNYMVSMTTH